MDFSRTLLLKGLGGLAAVGTVGGGVVYGRNMLLKNQEDKDKVREKVNDKLGSLGLPDDCRLGKEDDPYTINKECELDEGKLKKIKFSNKNGEEDLTVKGWPSEGGLKLKFERKNKEEDISFSFSGLAEGSEIKVFGDKSKGKIVIKNAGEGIKKFKEKDGQLTKDSSGVEEALKTKLEGFNKQLGTVNAPIECRFDELESEDSVECPISEGELKTMKFSGLGDGDLKIVGWTGNENVKLKAEKDSASQNEMSLSFQNISSEIRVFGDKSKGKIIVKSDKKFTVQDNKLTKGNRSSEIEKLNEQLGTINAPIECRFDEAESEASVECNISENDLKGMEFSNKEREGDLKIVGWSGNTNVKLKAEKNQDNSMSVSFTGVTTGSDIKVFGDKKKGKIIIKSDDGNNKKFKVEDGKLTKDSTGVDAALKSKLEKFNDQLGKVNAPIECRFDETETEASVECGVTPEDLKTMVFDKGGVTYSEGEDFAEMKLEVQSNEVIVSSEANKEIKVLPLTFKNYDRTIKLKKEGEKKEEEVISFIKGTNPEFGIYDIAKEYVNISELLVLDKIWEPESFEDLFGLTCTIPKDMNLGSCTFTGESKKIKVGKGTDGEFEELDVTNTSDKFKLHKDQEGFNQGFKFAYSGSKVTGSGGSPTLEENGEYEFKWKNEEGKPRTIYLVKKP